jgi:hypothetical protein
MIKCSHLADLRLWILDPDFSPKQWDVGSYAVLLQGGRRVEAAWARTAAWSTERSPAAQDQRTTIATA